MANVSFATGLQEAYQALVSASTVDENVIYFITDTRRIYKGSTQVADVASQQVVFTTTTPTPESSQEGILYVATVDGTTTIYVKSNNEMEVVGGGEAQSVADGSIVFDSLNSDMVSTTIGDSPSATKIPTEAAVKNYVDTAIASAVAEYDDAFTGVSAAPNTVDGETGTILTFTRKDGQDPVEVKIADLFLSEASYDPETHDLTLVVSGADEPVIVNLDDLVPQAVNTSQVAMADTITVTTPVGNFTKGQVVDVDDIQSFLVAMLSQDSNPTTTQPSVSVSLTGAGAKEVGSTFTPSWNVKLNPGSYSANKDGAQPTEVTATSYAVSDTNSGSASTQSGSFDAFTVLDNTNYRVSATVQHTAGAVPTTYLGEPYPAGQIAEGSKSGQSAAVTGFRKMFYGRTTSATALASAEIRALSGEAAAKKQLPEIVAQVGDRQVLVAFPSTLTATDPTFEYFTLSWGPFEGFVKSTVQVDGFVSGQNATEYTVWSYTAAAPLAAETRFRITIN